MSSQECEFHDCNELTKSKYCPEHQAEYEEIKRDELWYDMIEHDLANEVEE